MNMSVTELLEHVKSANEWADKISQAWAGTDAGRYIDREKEALKDAVEVKDWYEAYKIMVDLVDLCRDAERKLEEKND